MRVAVDATPLGSGLGGDETLLAGLLRGLVTTADPDHDEFVLLAGSDGELPPECAGSPMVTVIGKVVSVREQIGSWIITSLTARNTRA